MILPISGKPENDAEEKDEDTKTPHLFLFGIVLFVLLIVALYWIFST